MYLFCEAQKYEFQSKSLPMGTMIISGEHSPEIGVMNSRKPLKSLCIQEISYVNVRKKYELGKWRVHILSAPRLCFIFVLGMRE